MRLARQQLAGHGPHMTFRGTTSSTAHRTKHVIMSFCDQIAESLFKTCGRARARDRYEHTAYYAKRITRDRRLSVHLVGIHSVHLELVVWTLRRPTGRELKRKSRRQSEAVKNRPQSQSK